MLSRSPLVFLALLAVGPAGASPPTTAPTPAPARLWYDAVWLRPILERLDGKVPMPESVRMLSALVHGSQMGPGDGWFGPSRLRYGWDWLRARMDADQDGRLSRKEFRGTQEVFDRLDRDRDGAVTAEDLDWSMKSPFLRQTALFGQWAFGMDADSNGRVSRQEWQGFFDRLAKGKDHLTADDLRLAFHKPPPPKLAGKPPGMPSQKTLLEALVKNDLGSPYPGPRPGEMAPDFTLTTPDGKQTVTLSQYRGKTPVVLVLGNFSCGPFRSQSGIVDALAHRYKDRVAFVAVYVRDAHPTDGWRMMSNDRVGIAYRQPRTDQERVGVAEKCSATLGLTMPLLVDTIDDRVGHAYSGMPDRLYLIDREGKVAYQSGRGPFGFKAGELEQELILLLLDQEARAKKTSARLPLLGDAEAWKRLPAATRGANEPLPAWARALAAPLPRTTAAMLELDHLQRAGEALDPILRAKMRWAAADANGCSWTRAQALGDLRRAGADEAAIAALKGDARVLPPGERAALTFARKLTRAAHTVTDDEVAALVRTHGEKRVVAMVLLLAYANFQDRLVLTLGLDPAEDPPLPPLAVKFATGKDSPSRPPAPPRKPPAGSAAEGPPERVTDAAWLKLDFERLQKQMEQQRDRPGRVRVPAWEEVQKLYPPGQVPTRPLRIKWSLVCLGYQPELARGWGACTRAFGQEAKQDRVFEESLFWVVTRSLECFY